MASAGLHLFLQYSSFFCRQMKMAAPRSAAEATTVPLDMCVTLEKNSCGAKLLSISCSRTVYLPAGSFSICSRKIHVCYT
jgi:hypothetical protein